MRQQKSYKKFMATAATATLVATAIAPGASAATNFTDVSGHYVDPVDYLVSKKIAQGTSDTTFGTSQNISRGDAAVMIANALSLDTTSAPDAGFKDVNSRVAGAINALVQEGIAGGKTATEFDPSANITRQEMAKMLANAYKLTAQANAPFDDVNSNWIGYISALYEADITKGKTETTFSPTENLTRGEFAIFMYRAEGDQDEVETVVESVEMTNPTSLIVKINPANTGLEAKDFEVLVDGEAITPTKVTSNAAGDVYTLTIPTVDGKAGEVSVNGKTTDYDYSVPGVSAVKELSATQILVTFNHKVDKETAEAIANYKFTALDDQGVGIDKVQLGADEQSVVLTMDGPTEKRFHVKVEDILLKGETTKKIEAFDQVITFKADTVAPKVTGFEQVSVHGVQINFSEPIQAGAVFEFKDEDGTAIDGLSASYAAGDAAAVVDLEEIEAGKKVTVTIKNVKDMAGNLISPQPSTIVIEKKELSQFAPTINTITQTGAKTFTVKFSEAVVLDTESDSLATDIVLSPANVVSKLEKISATEYEVTTTDYLDGVATVKIAADKVRNELGQVAGEGSTIDKLVTFKKDSAAPTATAQLVVNDQNKQVLALTFDKEVQLTGTNGTAAVELTGSYVKDYVTTPGVDVATEAVYADGTGDDKKVVHVALTKEALAVAGAAYTLDLSSSEIKSVTDVEMDTMEVIFTRGTDGDAPIETNEDQVAVTKVEQTEGDNDELVVTFDKEVDAASATNIENYTIVDAEIETAKVLAENKKQVILKLKKDSVVDTYERGLTIENVKAKNSTVTMESYTSTIELTENVRPTIVGAEVTAEKEITITFSKAIAELDVEAFVVNAGTEAIGLDELTAVDGQVIINLESPLSSAQIAEGITLAPANDDGQVNENKFVVKDTNGNRLEAFDPLTVATP